MTEKKALIPTTMDASRCGVLAARAAGPVRGGVRAYSSAPPGVRSGRMRPQRTLRRSLPPFREWVRGEGARFREPPPGKGPHWIGATPFPLNPSFNPPAPIAQSLRDDMWALHTRDPAQWTVRSLSDRFKLGLARTEAVLRLKALEDEWTHEVRWHGGGKDGTHKID